MHIVPLVGQPDKRTAHGYYVVIGMRRKYNRAFLRRLAALRTLTIVRIGFSAGPPRDGMLQLIEYININMVHGALLRSKLSHTVRIVIVFRELKNRLLERLRKPHDCFPDGFTIPQTILNQA